MCIGRVVFGPSLLTPLAIVCPHRVIWALLMCDKNIHLPPTFYGYYDDSLFSFLSSFLFFYFFILFSPLLSSLLARSPSPYVTQPASAHNASNRYIV
jgi:hypothetical protein